jgi:hypothetical protein
MGTRFRPAPGIRLEDAPLMTRRFSFDLNRIAGWMLLLAAIPIGLVAAASMAGAAPAAVVRFDAAQLAFEPSAAGTRVSYPGAVSVAAGAPDLPRVLTWIEVPAGMRATSVRAVPSGLRDLGATAVAKAAVDQRTDGVTWPESAPAPPAAGWAELGAQGSLRGHWIVGVLVAPVQWDPATQALTAAREVRIELELRPATAAELAQVAPRARVVREIEAEFEAGAAKLVDDLVPATPTESLLEAAGTGPAGPGPYQPSFRPTPDGSAVEYVIVTSQAMAGEFQRLADWKTQKGVQTVVRTVEWIDQTYPNGVDRAERIRFFVRDAYQNWDTAFVLLGGDTDVVAPRYAQMLIFNEKIPADYYYACLDGNWNADGDARFAESISGGSSDNCDLLFDVSVGRAPVSSVSQAQVFVDKILSYEKNPPVSPRYPASILVLAERLFPTLHGAEVAEDALAMVPSWVRVARLYEQSVNFPGSIELTRPTATDSINAGFGIVHHVGHGYRNSMSVGNGTFSNADADAFVNAPRNSVVFAINCSSASIDFNSIGERWVKNPNGGSSAYIGTSRNAFVLASRPYQNKWYATVWQDSVRSLGRATDQSRLILVPQSLFDTQQRWNLMATTLLGDPESDIYTNAVIPMQVAHPASVALGAAPITVTVTSAGSPVVGATVTLWKAGDAYVRAVTGAAGTAQLPITATTTGNLTLTAELSYHQPYQATLPLTAAAGPYVFIDAFTIDDDAVGQSSGDGDGQADAGETIELRVRLKNGGVAPATGVQGTLSESDPAVSILQASTGYGTIAAGGTANGAAPFLVSVSAAAEVAAVPVFTLTATSGQGTFVDQAVMPIRRSFVDHHAHLVDDAVPRGDGDGEVEAGEQIRYSVTLRNSGQDRAVAVTGKLHALHWPDLEPDPNATVTDSLASFGTLAPGATATGDIFAFTLGAGADPEVLRLELLLSDGLGPISTQLTDVLAPSASDSIVAFGSPTAIRLEWKRAPELDVSGYDVFRAPSPGGPFARVNTYTVDGVAAYEDQNLAPLTRYYYQVVTRDSSANASPVSFIVSGTTNPPIASGWPAELAQNTSSSVVVADIDGGNHIELACGADVQYAWHGDGTELVDGDQDPRTNGPISLYGRSTITGFAATPAIGDLDGDGTLEIANVGFTQDTLYVWRADGTLFPGWPKSVLDHGTPLNWGSPLITDLDQDGGHLEVVLWAANGGNLFAWHDNGVELVDGDQNPETDGVLVNISGNSFNYGSPAVAQLDADQELEILVPINFSPGHIGAIYAFNIDGTPVPGWPFLTGGGGNNSEVSSSPAVGDLDHDGEEEIVVSCERDFGSIYVIKRDGTVAPNWPRLAAARTSQSRLPSPVLADVDGDTFLDVIFPDTDGVLRVMDRNGIPLPGFPVTYYVNPPAEGTQSTPAVGDIDGDGQLEIVFGDEAGRVHAYNHDGTLAAGFPIQTNGEVRGTPALWDVDRDNRIEVAVAGFDGNVYVWDLAADFQPTRLPWPFFRHDTRNTGRIVTSVQPPTGIADPEPPSAPGFAAPAFHAPHPNPFNPYATLSFDVPGQRGGARPVTLVIYDASGRLVRRLVSGAVGTGPKSVVWDGRDQGGRPLGSGIYFARITIGEFAASRKLALIR